LIDQALRALPESEVTASADPRARVVVAMAYTGLAENTLTSPKDALDARNRAIELFKSALATAPTNEEAARFLSISLKRRAAMKLGRMKDAAGAVADLNSASSIDEGRIARDPASATVRLDFALGEGYRSTALKQMGDLEGALAALDRALTTRRQIVAADPRNVRVLTQLLADYGKRAALLKDLGRSEAARAALQDGLALADHLDPSVPVTPELGEAIAALRTQAGPPR
jgi:tetratricopeptide (TPR) repeat protein